MRLLCGPLSEESIILWVKKGQIKDGKYKVIYCHFDGYLEHNGEILVNHYKDRKKVEELLTLGDLSSLAENINPDPTKEHSYEYSKRQENVCVSYNRDRQDNDPEKMF